MSPRVKPFAIYLMFVGGPMLGLAAVLYAGRGLASPMSVGGPWTVGFERGAEASTCGGEGGGGAAGAKPDSLTMQVSQAGSLLTIRFEDPAKKTTLTGKLQDGVADLHAKGDKDKALIASMHAEIAPGAAHDSMTGTMRLASCGGGGGGQEAHFHAHRDGNKEKH
jgi:hypothetical protein